jgi:hypothetical protein
VRRLFTAAGILLLLALFYAGLVMGSSPADEPEQRELSLPKIGNVQSSDPNILSKAFGTSFPHVSDTGKGSVSDSMAGTLSARILVWQESDGFTVTAVRPAQAAMAIRRKGLVPDTSALWSVGGETLMLASGSGDACAYYDNDLAAFCLYRPEASTEEILQYLSASVSFPSAEQDR